MEQQWAWCASNAHKKTYKRCNVQILSLKIGIININWDFLYIQSFTYMIQRNPLPMVQDLFEASVHT